MRLYGAIELLNDAIVLLHICSELIDNRKKEYYPPVRLQARCPLSQGNEPSLGKDEAGKGACF
jgi:hypothetical protein